MVTAERPAGVPASRGLRLRAGAALVAARVAAAAASAARRPDVQIVGALLLAVFAARSGLRHTAGLSASVAIGLALAATLPLTVVRLLPFASLAATVAASSAFVVVARLAWPTTAIVAWLISLALTSLLLRRWQAVTILVAAELAVIAAVFVPQRINATPWDATIAESFAALTVWWIGENIRARREVRVERVITARRLQAFAERDAVARERARIARELHDVVAHHVSTIAVRAATLPYEVDDLPLPVRSALTEIAEGARAALVDLRAVLGVLRRNDDDGGDGEATPQPRLTELSSLVARVSATGTPVVLRVDGHERPLTDGAEVCGYRIVQESLTNVIKHAPGSRAEIGLVYGSDDVTICVRDDGAGRPYVPGNGAGLGLLGMRERVTMLGGSLRAGPRRDGGFEVVAKLPCPGASVASAAERPMPVAHNAEEGER